MWNVVKSAVKEFVVALNEEDDEGNTLNTTTPSAGEEYQYSLPGETVKIDEPETKTGQLLDSAIDSMPKTVDSEFQETTQVENSAPTSGPNVTVNNDKEGEKYNNLFQDDLDNTAAKSDSPSNNASSETLVTQKKSEHEWMERMWKAERAALLKRVEKAEERIKHCRCEQPKMDGEKESQKISSETDSVQSAGIGERGSPSAETLRRRVSDLKEENQLLRVSIKRLLTHIYSQNGVLD